MAHRQLPRQANRLVQELHAQQARVDTLRRTVDAAFGEGEPQADEVPVTVAIADFVTDRLREEAAAAAAAARMARSMTGACAELQPQLDHALRPTGWLAVAPARVGRAIDTHLSLVLEWTRAAAVREEGDVERGYAEGLAVAIAILSRTWQEHPAFESDWAP